MTSTTSTTKGKLLRTLPLYSDECFLLLKTALETAETQSNHAPALTVVSYVPTGARGGAVVMGRNRRSDASSSSSSSGNKEDENAMESSSDDESSSSDEEKNDANVDIDAVAATPLPRERQQQQQQQEQQPQRSSNNSNKAKHAATKTKVPTPSETQILKHLDATPCVSLSLYPSNQHANSLLAPPHEEKNQQEDENCCCVLEIPSALLSRDDRRSGDPVTAARSLLKLASQIGSSEKAILVLFVRSGRFAGAIFRGATCLAHRTSTRYTVRKGQGKAQSSQDAGGRRPKSVGAQLRRAGEMSLKEDITNAVLEWLDYIKTCALILVSCPKTMQKSLYECLEDVVKKDDPRIRKIPLDVGRPTFENAVLIHSVLTTAVLRRVHQPPPKQPQRLQEEHASAFADGAVIIDGGSEKGQNEPLLPLAPTTAVESMLIPSLPLTPLHEAAAHANVEALLALLSSLKVSSLSSLDAAAAATTATGDNQKEAQEMQQQQQQSDGVDSVAGDLLQTPLHYAAAAAAAVTDEEFANAEAAENYANNNISAAAAECVYHLLVTGHADPCVVDARNRPPYYLATSDIVRDAFRRARAVLGEDYCEWNNRAKVGPPLTEDDIRLKKEKEADKKRKKKARQKEKKVKDKAQAEAVEQQKREMEEKIKQEEDAKRIRDRLQPKSNTAATNVCDFCQNVCKGKRRIQMFQRLDYAYCSTDCVQKHKRELMAAAAMARFGTPNS